MVGKLTKDSQQQHLFKPDLMKQLNPGLPLMRLSQIIPWQELEQKLVPLYAKKGRPAKPIRLMVGLIIIKHLEDLSDEHVVEQWIQNPYYQAFCGEQFFQWKFPCDPSDLTYFRKRIGKEGCELIFKHSTLIHEEKALESDVVVDTTVQEKNITYPTDTKLHLKIWVKVVAIGKKENVSFYRTYKKEVARIMKRIRFDKSKKALARKKITAAKKRLKTIAAKLLRELIRKLPEHTKVNYQATFDMFFKILAQEKNSKNKIYSIHEPHVECIAKGKSHKKYEFGAKAGLIVTKTTGIIIGVQSFTGNPYDGNTLETLLKNVEKTTGIKPVNAYCDRGFRGTSVVGTTQIHIPKSDAPTAEEQAIARKNFRRRSSIEGIISHVKNDFRLARCYLKGVIGDEINLLLAASAFNFKKMMNKWGYALFCAIMSVLGLCMAKDNVEVVK